MTRNHRPVAQTLQNWEERQALATCQEGGVCVCGSVLSRNYPLTLAAGWFVDHQFYRDVEELFMEEGKWCIVSTSSWESALRCLAFRLVARQGAALRQQVSFAHSTFPVQAFKLIKQLDLWQAFHQLPPCHLVCWAPSALTSSRSSMQDDDVTTLRIALALHAMLQSLSTHQSEAGHASVRRTLVMEVFRSGHHSLLMHQQCASSKKPGGVGGAGGLVQR